MFSLRLHGYGLVALLSCLKEGLELRMRNMDKAPSVPYLDANGWKHREIACQIRKFEFRVKRIDKKKEFYD